MNKWVVRSFLFVMLVTVPAILAIFTTVPMVNVDIKTTVTQLLAKQGLRYRETRSFSDGSLISMLFELPKCAEPLQVIPTSNSFEARGLFDKAARPEDTRLFAYLGKVSREQSDRWTFREHLKHRLLELLSLSPYEDDRQMLLIVTPKDCNLPQIDWSLVWRTNYRRSIALTKAPG